MKNFVIASLSILCLSLSAISASAETNLKQSLKLATTTSSNTTIAKVTPFELVSLAYQGYYRNQGIPGFGSFLSGYTTNRITAQDLVTAAIALKELPPETLTDRAYLNNIDFQLLDTAE